MEIIKKITENSDVPLALSIGNFDGIHKGHREIIKNLIQKTKISKYKSIIIGEFIKKDKANIFCK